MLKRLFITIFAIILLGAQSSTKAQDSEQLIRVGISDNNFKNLICTTREFSSDRAFDVIDLSSGDFVANIPAYSNIKITLDKGIFNVYNKDKVILISSNGPLVIKTKENGLLTIPNLKRVGKPALYRGVFEIVKNSQKDNLFSTVNVLDLENYLRGVVPNEMPVRFGLEALKAQTIAARNYALKPREKFYKEFDVCDSVASQVYFGANTESELSNLAIKQTNGLVAIYDDNLILALYSSTAGGYTESYENAFSEPKTRIFPARPVPYLKAKPDNPSIKNLSDENEVKKFYLSYPDTFDNKSPYFRWEREWKLAELEQVLQKTLLAQSTTGFIKPQIKNSNEIGLLKAIKVNKRGESGKIMNLDIVTDKNTFNVSKELVIRRLLQKNGQSLPSANFVIDTISNPNGTTDGFIFHGGGFGHGVGISQWGAGAMSAKGYMFDEILQHYYTGISIATTPVLIQNCSPKNQATQTFYAPYKKAWLCIDNINGVHSIITVINGKKLPIDTSSTFQRKLRIDIKDYITTGENSILYYVEPSENGRKAVKMYVEVIEAENG